MAKRYLSIEEVSERLHMSKFTAHARISRGLPMPPSIKIGRRRLFSEEVFENWMAQRQENTESIPEESLNLKRKQTN